MTKQEEARERIKAQSQSEKEELESQPALKMRVEIQQDLIIAQKKIILLLEQKIEAYELEEKMRSF